MKFRTVSAGRLTQAEITAWSSIQRAHAGLCSPFFCPEFTQLVASVRPDVEVAVLEDSGGPVGFFPFQRVRSTGWPVGSGLNDFQGLIAAPDLHLDPRELLRACGLAKWHFDNLVLHRSPFNSFLRRQADSPYVDLSAGFEMYLSQRSNRGHFMQEYRRYSRKLNALAGPLRYEVQVSNRDCLATLLSWKNEQIRRMRVPNIYDYVWVRDLLESIVDFHNPDFSSLLSVAYGGDRVVAIQFTLRSRDVQHGWVMAYDREFAHCSPGFLAMVESFKAAPALGIRRIDLGKGPEAFKQHLMSSVTAVGEGTADFRRTTAAIRTAWWKAGKIVLASPLSSPARGLARQLRRARHWVAIPFANRRKNS